MMYFGSSLLMFLFIWILIIAITFGLLYLCVRLAVLSALKAHTAWLRQSMPGTPGIPPASGASGGPGTGAGPAGPPQPRA